MNKREFQILLLGIALLGAAFGLMADNLDRITDLCPGACHAYPGSFAEYNGKLYFSASNGVSGFELWVFDGVTPPAMVADIYPGASGSNPRAFEIFQGKLYFSANDGAHGAELWAYDGVNPPYLVADIWSGAYPSSPNYLTVFNDRLYFSASDGAPHGYELFAYDGVSAPILVADINPHWNVGGYSESSYPTDMTVFNGKLYFAADDGTNGEELWVYDGSLPPQMVAPGMTPRPYFLTEYKNELYFRFIDSTGRFGLMKYDGTNPPVQISFPQNSPEPYYPTVFNDKLYFFATDAISGRELWSYDGVGTPTLVADINPGVNDAISQTTPSNIMPYAGKLYFQATNGISGYELWSVDGAGTPQLVGDISPGAGNAFPTELHVFNDRLYFSAEDGATGKELWSCIPGSLTITAPNGGELWLMGTSHDITWTSAGTVGDVDIHYSTDNGSTWTLIVGGTANDGLHEWTVPATPSVACMVRVQENDGSPSDASDAVFATATLPAISGTVTIGGSPLAGVVMSGLPGDPATNSSGVYSSTVTYNWSGTATPTLAGYAFSPANRVYVNITMDQTGQDYTSTSTAYTISGTVLVDGSALAGVVMSGLPGNPTTDSSGVYSGTVPFNWSGTVTPTLAGYTFSPENRTYSNVSADQAAQDYTATGDIPTITVTSPNGGETWLPNSNHMITWTTSGFLLDVNIELSLDAGVNWNPVAGPIPAGIGSYEWLVPDTPSADCLMRITRADGGPLAGDESDAPFTIIPPSITVTSPNGGETWLPNSSHMITWTTSGFLLDVNIELSLDAGVNWNPVAGPIPAGIGSYEWLVPDTPSADCLMRITRADGGPLAGDESNAPFTIIPPSITVTSPNGGETWLPNSNHMITWTTSGFLLDVNIELSLDAGVNWNPVAGPIPAGIGSYEWLVPDTPSADCLMRITRADGGPLAGDESNAPFTIIPPSITVTSPNGGETWLPNSNHMITWTTSGFLLDVNIELSLDAGVNWNPVAGPIPAGIGSYEWLVPDTPSADCLMRITRADGGPLAGDESDAPFTILPNVEETVSAPAVPIGPIAGVAGTSYTYSADGASCTHGHGVQYRFDWGDTTVSDWLEDRGASAAHTWLEAGTYNVRAQARCAVNEGIMSAWSDPIVITLDEDPTWVAVSGFAACAAAGQPTVEWHTGTEAGAVGFNLWRQDRESKEFVRANDVLLPALASAPQGGVYRFADPGAFPGEPATYRLEEVDSQGRARSYGPFTVIFGASPAEEPSLADLRIGREEESGIYGYQRFERGQSEMEESRMRARLEELHNRRAEPAMDAAAGRKRARITVKGKGLFYVASGQVASALGVSQQRSRQLISGYNLNLTSLGREIAWLADASGAGLFFYNEGKETVYADKNVYFLEQGSGRAMETVGGGNAGPASAGQCYQATLHLEGNRYSLLLASLDPAGDLWFWDYVIAGAVAKSFAVQVPGVAGSGEAALFVSLQGTTDTAASQDHHAIVSLNGRQIGEATWDGTTAHAFEVAFDSSLLQEGANTIAVAGALDMGAPYSVFYVESFDVRYQRRYQAVANSLICRGDGNPVVTVSGLTEAQALVLDVTVPERPKRLSGVAPDLGGNVTFVPRDDGNDYLVSGLNAAQRPLAVAGVRSAGLGGRGHRADYVVIAPSELAQAAQELAEYRQGRGLKAVVVTLADIYDEFNYGAASPYAIRDFLAHAYRNWSGRKLKYAVLAGKGTYDYKDCLGHGDNLVPAILGATPEGLCAADRMFGDVSGSDGLPEIAIGRLPAVTSAELQAMIAKVKACESGQGEWTGQGLFLADNADDGGDFAVGSDELAALATGVQAEKIYLDGSAAEERARLLASWNAGVGLVNYCGHGGIHHLTADNLFHVADAAALQNGGRLPLAVMLTCVVGRFELAGYTSLGEALLLNANGGMAGGLMPSGAALHSDSMRLAAEFYKAAFRGREESAGKALLAAMKAYIQQGGAAYLLNVYNWLGDPATEFK